MKILDELNETLETIQNFFIKMGKPNYMRKKYNGFPLDQAFLDEFSELSEAIKKIKKKYEDEGTTV